MSTTTGRYSVYKDPTDDLAFENRLDFLTKMFKRNLGIALAPILREQDQERPDAIRVAMHPTESVLQNLFHVPTVGALLGLAFVATLLTLGLSLNYPSVFTPEVIITILSTVFIFTGIEVATAFGRGG